MDLSLTFLVKFCQPQGSQCALSGSLLLPCGVLVPWRLWSDSENMHLTYSPEPDPARTPCGPTACWDSHFVNLSMESYGSCKFRKKKSCHLDSTVSLLQVLASLVWLNSPHLMNQSIHFIKRGALAQCCQSSEMYLGITSWEQSALTSVRLYSTGQCATLAVLNSPFCRAFGFVQGLSKLTTLK